MNLTCGFKIVVMRNSFFTQHYMQGIQTSALEVTVLEGLISKLGIAASAISIVSSVYVYFGMEDEMLGIFVGLWAPTLILFSQEIEKLM